MRQCVKVQKNNCCSVTDEIGVLCVVDKDDSLSF